MKRIFFLLLFVGLLLSAQVETNKWYDEIQEINKVMIESILNKTPETSIDLFLENAVSLPSYNPMVVGVDNMMAATEDQQDDDVRWLNFELNPLYIWESGEFVVEIGNYEYAMDIAGMPEPYKDVGKYLTLYEIQDDGKLKIKAETWNTDLNPWAMLSGPPAPEGEIPPPPPPEK